MKITSEANSLNEDNIMNEDNSLNYNACTINDLLEIKIREDKDSDLSSNFDSSVDNSDESNDLLDTFNERKTFVIKCRQELHSKLPEHFDQWTIKKQYDHLISNISKYFPNIPESLRYFLPAIFENGDYGRRVNEKPDWLIMDKFYRGQRFAQRYISVVFLSSLMGLIQIYTFSEGLKPLILSQKSNTPYRAFERYLSTFRTFRNWFTSNPWCKDTPAYRDIQRVRRLHRAMRSKLCRKNFEEIDRDSEIQNAWCPVLGKITEDFANTCPIAKNQQCPFWMTRTRALNQGDMSGTQFAGVGMIVLYPEKFGIYASDEDLEAFCHLWSGLGYLLGIEDQYNFCLGDLREVRQRSKDFIEQWIKPNLRTVTSEWEHMIMCIHEGIGYMLPFNNFPYKLLVLHLCDILEISMPRLYGSFSLSDKIFYVIHKFLFSYIIKLPGIMSMLNAVSYKYLDQAVAFESVKHAELKKKSSKKVQEIVPFKFDYIRTL